jgi:hypothetical protein
MADSASQALLCTSPSDACAAIAATTVLIASTASWACLLSWVSLRNRWQSAVQPAAWCPYLLVCVRTHGRNYNLAHPTVVRTPAVVCHLPDVQDAGKRGTAFALQGHDIRECAERCNDRLNGASSAGFGCEICAVGSQCAERIANTGKQGSFSRVSLQHGNSCFDRASCASIRRTFSVIQGDIPKRHPAETLHNRVCGM